MLKKMFFSVVILLSLYLGAFATEITVNEFTSTAIQNAYNTLNATAGNHVIKLPYGEYSFTDSIVCNAGSATSITIIGADSSKLSVLNVGSITNAIEIRRRNVTIEGLEIVTTQTGVKIGGGSVADANNARIKRCFIHPSEGENVYRGINIQKISGLADSAHLINNLIVGVSASGIECFTSGTEEYHNLSIISNTIIMGDGLAKTGTAIKLRGGISSVDSITIKNNLIVGADTGITTTDTVFKTGDIKRDIIYNVNSEVNNIELFRRTSGTLPLNDILHGILVSNPYLASTDFLCNTVGMTFLNSSQSNQIIDRGSTAGDAPKNDIYNRIRNTHNVDIGAIEYYEFCDTIYVKETGSNSSNGRYPQTPVSSVNYAFSKKLPSNVFYPVIIKVMPGEYSEAGGANYNLRLTGKTFLMDGKLTIKTATDEDRPVFSSDATARGGAIIKGDYITLDGLVFKVDKGVGISIGDDCSNINIDRCFIMPGRSDQPGPDPAIEVVSNSTSVKNIKVQNCLIDYRGTQNGAIVLNSTREEAKGIDTTDILYNTIFLESNAGNYGIKVSQTNANSISNLRVLYNIIDSPKNAAFYLDNSILYSKADTNCIFNSPKTADGAGASSFTIGLVYDVDPKFVSKDIESSDFLKIDSINSPLSGKAGNATDGISPLVDYTGLTRPASAFAIGAYEPSGVAVIDTPQNKINLTVLGIRRDKFTVSFNNLTYSTRDIDTLGLWYFEGTLPDLNSIDMSKPNKKYNYGSILVSSFTDSIVNPSFESGATYYFLASVRNREGVWAPLDSSNVVMEKVTSDNNPPPAVLKLSVNRISDTTYNSLQLSWSGGDGLIGTDADTIGIWRRSDAIPPTKAGDSLATLVGMYPVSSVGIVYATGLIHNTTYYFSVFVRDTANNWSTWSDSSSCSETTPKSTDVTPPTNNLKIQLVSDTSTVGVRTSILVLWDTLLLTENDLTAEIRYDTVSLSSKSKSVDVSADSGRVVISNLNRNKLYRVGLFLKDASGNISVVGSIDSIKTKLGDDKQTFKMFTDPDTINLEYSMGTIKMGWNCKSGGGISVDVRYLDTLLSSSVENVYLFPLSDVVYLSEGAPYLDSAYIYLSVPIKESSLQALATSQDVSLDVITSQARLYCYSNDKWNVVHKSEIIDSRANAQIKESGFYVIMWDNIAPSASIANVMQRNLNGVTPLTTLKEVITIGTGFEVGNVAAYLSYNIAGCTNVKSDTLYFKDGSVEVSVPGEYITERGYKANVVVSDGAHSSVFDISYPVKVSGMAMRPIEEKEFSFISIPGYLTDKSGISIFKEILRGSYDSRKLRLFRYDTEKGKYEEAKNGYDFNLEPGAGYWLITKNTEQGISVGAGKTVSGSRNYNIALNPLGWTDIGIPFNFVSNGDTGVCLGDIIDSSKALIKGNYRFYSYDPKNKVFVPLFPPTDPGAHYTDYILKPWTGYAVYSFNSTTTQLKIPPISSKYSKYSNSVASKKLDVSKNCWWMNITLKKEDGEDIYNGVGYFKKGMSNKDIYTPKLFGPSADVKIYQLYKNTKTDKVAKVAYVVNKDLSNGKSWDYVLKNDSKKKQNVTVVFNPTEDLPKEYSCVVWNPALSDETMDIKKGSQFKMTLSDGDSVAFKVLVGTQEYLKGKLADLSIPKSFTLYGNYPNPFNPATMISFDIPFFISTPDVLVKIYNCHGEKVKTIYNGSTPGHHRVMWFGDNTNGKQLSSGLYFVNISAVKSGKVIYSATKKLMMMK